MTITRGKRANRWFMGIGSSRRSRKNSPSGERVVRSTGGFPLGRCQGKKARFARRPLTLPDLTVGSLPLPAGARGL